MMKKSRLNRVLSAALAGILLCSTAAYAGEPESMKAENAAAWQGISDEDELNKDKSDKDRSDKDELDKSSQDEGGAVEDYPGNMTAEDSTPAEDGQVPTPEKGEPASGEDGESDKTAGEPDGGEADESEEEQKLENQKESQGSQNGESSLVQPDAGTEKLLNEYEHWLTAARTGALSYSEELKKFPESYQSRLAELHKLHPEWVFVAVDTGLKWRDVVAAETTQNRSLIPVNSGSLLLSKASSDYNASKGTYIPKDGVSWVTASRPAVAYYLDPRNFLTEDYVYMFEALDYNEACHTVEGVEEILKGTDLAKKKVTYTNTKGKKVSLNKTYAQLIYAAGADNNVSPLFLASKIRQETGASLSNGSISGNFSYGGGSYRGYYNFYNIGAFSTSTGSAVANGLSYAKGGKTYGRPWNSPVKSIDGGAQFLAQAYIARGQNTIYFEKFNTVTAPYYQNQYMQNVTAAASESWSTYNSYNNMGIADNPYVFYIPVYKDMPPSGNKLTIKKSTKKGKTTGAVKLRKGPSTGYGSLVTIPKGATVTVSDGVHTDEDATVAMQLANPYWIKVKYQSKTGYISASYLKMNSGMTVPVKGTMQLSVSGAASGEQLYYETSNPAVATVDSIGRVKGIKKGTCMVYAVSGSGKTTDVIGIKVGASSVAPPAVPEPEPTVLTAPEMKSAVGFSTYIKAAWNKVSSADGYYLYRKTAEEKWTKIATLKGADKLSFKDKTAKKGITYYYTVKAYRGSEKSAYAKKSVKGKRVQLKSYKVKTALNYRSGAGTSYAQKGVLKKGTRVKIVKGWSKKADGYTWYKMSKGTKYYYIVSRYLKKK